MRLFLVTIEPKLGGGALGRTLDHAGKFRWDPACQAFTSSPDTTPLPFCPQNFLCPSPKPDYRNQDSSNSRLVFTI